MLAWICCTSEQPWKLTPHLDLDLRVRAAIAQAADPHYLGVVFAQDAVDLPSPVSGQISEIFVELGQTVRAGQRVAAVDARALQRDIEAAQASLSTARARRDRFEVAVLQAQEQFDRAKSIAETLSQEELRAIELNVRLAQADVQAASSMVNEAEAAMHRLQLSLSNTDVRATLAGRISHRYVNRGSWVSPGSRIVRLVPGDDVWVRFAVPEDVARDLKEGAELGIQGGSLLARATLRHVAPEVDAPSGLVFAEATLAPTDAGLLQIGQAVRVLIEG